MTTRTRGESGEGRHFVPTVWGRIALTLIEGAASIGLQSEACCRALGLELPALRDSDARVPLESLYALFEHVVERTGDELAPLAMGRTIELHAFDAVALLMMTSPTIGAALDASMRYQRVFIEGERYPIDEIGDDVHIRYEPFGPARPGHRAMADLFARDLAVNVTTLASAPMSGIRVRLRHAPDDPARHAELLGVAAELGAPVDEVVYPRSALDVPIARIDPSFAGFLERYLDERLARLPERSPVSRIRAAIERAMPGGALSLRAVARGLNVSPRTLQRWLGEESTSFASLVEEIRRARSLALVEAGASTAEIAWLLGYSEASAFHRAFRRWTHMTPAQWRARAAHQHPSST